jgi:hypothetical protein
MRSGVFGRDRRCGWAAADVGRVLRGGAVGLLERVGDDEALEACLGCRVVPARRDSAQPGG